MGGLPPDCTLRDTGPKEAKGVTTSAATRLMGIRGRQRGEGPSAGTQTSEEDPHLAQNPWLPHPAPLVAVQPAQASGEHGAYPLSGAAGGDPAVLLLHPVQLQGHRNALASDLRRQLEIPDVHRSGKAVLSLSPSALHFSLRIFVSAPASVGTRFQHPLWSSPLPQ